MMTEKFKILANYIKDMSSETPDIETFLFVKENISRYQLNISINSKALKNKLIEINTTLKFEDKEVNEKKSYYEIVYASIVKVSEDIKEKKELMKSMDIDQSGLDQFISSGFKLLNLVTFFTSGEKETKAWTLKKESYAPDAAGKIHTDFKKGFIAADVISCDKLLKLGGEKEAKLSGKIILLSLPG